MGRKNITSKKYNICKIMVLAIAVWVAVFGVALMAYATDVSSTVGITGLSVVTGGTILNETSGKQTVGVQVENGTDSCGGITSYSAQSATITLTNNTEKKQILSFVCTITGSSGASATSKEGTNEATNLTSGQQYTYFLDAEESVVITANAENKANSNQSISLSGISFIEDNSYTVTLNIPTEGSYRVVATDATGTTTTIDMTMQSTEVETISVTSNSGATLTTTAPQSKVLNAWLYTSATITKYIATGTDNKFTPWEDCTISPVFIETPAFQPFRVGASSYYYTWEAAFAAAGAGGTVVLVAEEYELPTTAAANGLVQYNGQYVTSYTTVDSSGIVTEFKIPDGMTLILPYDVNVTTLQEQTAEHPYALATYPSTALNLATKNENVSVELIVPENTDIEVSGKLALGGALGSMQGFAGFTAKDTEHANIVLKNGSQLNVSGQNAVLSCCGYIYNYEYAEGETPGSDVLGKVTVQDAGTVYEPFVVTDFWGGGYTLASAGRSVGSTSNNPNLVVTGATLSTSPDSGYLGNRIMVEGETAVFPFQRWSLMNIQSTFRIEGDGIVIGYADLNAFQGTHNKATIDIINMSSEVSLLLVNEDTVVTCTYDEDHAVTTLNEMTVEPLSGVEYGTATSKIGRTNIIIENGADFGGFDIWVSFEKSLSLYRVYVSVTMTSLCTSFPLPYNISVTLQNGSYSINSPMSLLPGSTLIVDNGATLTVGDGGKLTAFTSFYDQKTTVSSEHSGIVTTPEDAYCSSPSVGYPTCADLTAAGYNGTSEFIVNGNLVIATGGTFGGIVQTGKAGSGSVQIYDNASVVSTTQKGAIGNAKFTVFAGISEDFYLHASGATIHEIPAQLFDPSTQSMITLEAGKTYTAIPIAEGKSNFTHGINEYSYTLYTHSDYYPTYAEYKTMASKDAASLTDTEKTYLTYVIPRTITDLDIETEGGWYRYIINAELAEGSEAMSTSSLAELFTVNGYQQVAGTYAALESSKNVQNIIGTSLGGSFSFTVPECVTNVTASVGTLTYENGVYTIDAVNADTTLTLTIAHDYTKQNYDHTNHWMECVHCGDLQSTSVSNHSFTTEIPELDCSQVGYAIYECGCGYSYTDTFTAPHSENCNCNKASSLIDIYGSSVQAGETLNVFFYVEKLDGVDYSNYKAVISRVGEDPVEKVFGKDWKLFTDTNGNQFYRFAYDGLAAKEMADHLFVTIYDGETIVSNVFDESIENYAVNLLSTISADTTDETQTTMRTALVDMLNYGAACQTHFGYNLDALANAQIEAFQQYATKETAICSASATGDANYFVEQSVSVENSLKYTFFFQNIDPTTPASVTYKDHYGNEKSVSVGIVVDENGLYRVDVPKLAIADGCPELTRTDESRDSIEITCVVKNANGEDITVTGSIESYAKMAMRLYPEDQVFHMLIRFASSAYEYFCIVKP